ncbi:MAG: (2Fe-2S)-binding protein [Acidimicrobiales bacterium]
MVVCHCRALNYAAIVELVRSGERTVEALAAACGAGGDCGGCRPVLEEMLAVTDRSGPEATSVIAAPPVGGRSRSIQSAA